MTNILRCPLCKKSLTQEEYDKVLGTWDERKKALAALQSELANQKKVMAQEKARLATAHKNLKERERRAIAEAQKKAKEKFDKERRLLQSRIERQVARQTAQANREVAKTKIQMDRLRAATERQITNRVRMESNKLTPMPVT